MVTRAVRTWTNPVEEIEKRVTKWRRTENTKSELRIAIRENNFNEFADITDLPRILKFVGFGNTV